MSSAGIRPFMMRAVSDARSSGECHALVNGTPLRRSAIASA
jgi:hypothetical protein